MDQAKALTRARTNPQAAFGHIASAARTANRVIAVTKGEAENSLDADFQRKLEACSEAVTQSESTPYFSLIHNLYMLTYYYHKH